MLQAGQMSVVRTKVGPQDPSGSARDPPLATHIPLAIAASPSQPADLSRTLQTSEHFLRAEGIAMSMSLPAA